MKLKLLCEASGIVCPAEAMDMEITALATDSRRAVSGGMFICLRGLHTDGHTYIEEAIQRGICCVLIDRYTEFESERVTVLRCADTRRAAAYLFHAWYGFPCRNLKIIGVTGTNGKTSVAHMLRTILRTSWHTCGIIGTVGCESECGVIDTANGMGLANLTTPDPRDLYRIFAQMQSAKKVKFQFVGPAGPTANGGTSAGQSTNTIGHRPVRNCGANSSLSCCGAGAP